MGNNLAYCNGFNTTRDTASGSNQARATAKTRTYQINRLHVHGTNVDLYTRSNTARWNPGRMGRGAGLERL